MTLDILCINTPHHEIAFVGALFCNKRADTISNPNYIPTTTAIVISLQQPLFSPRKKVSQQKPIISPPPSPT